MLVRDIFDSSISTPAGHTGAEGMFWAIYRRCHVHLDTQLGIRLVQAMPGT